MFSKGEMSMAIDYTLFQKAYKKLKSNIYYDKTELILRNRIVEFEDQHTQDDTFDKLLQEMFQIFTDTDEERYQKLCSEITSTIQYHAFPKKIVSGKTSQENNKQKARDNEVLFNFSDKTTEISELQYFIDMDIRGHILGVVWLMLVGYRIDQNCIYEHSYGNRIRKNLYNEFSEKPTYSPYLFEPYFHQYESWRDYGLNKAQAYLKEQRDVIVMTLDFKRFYYSVDMNQEAFDRLLKDADLAEDDNYTLCKRLNDFVCSVVNSYANLFEESKYNGRRILPIGFLPSNILSNWCLRNFDKAIVDGWNPLYYGRYVDDILIVDKVDHNSDLYHKARQQAIKKDKIVEFLLQQCTRWSGIEDCGGEEKEKLCRELAPFIISKGADEITYQVNPRYNPMKHDRSNIELQNSKLKIFYFKSGETDSLITCFKEEISKNKSEFRFMPQDDAVFFDNDYGEIYDLNYKDTINKFRGIEGMSIDPYKLSKFLGKYLRIGSMVDDKAESRFAKDILKIFDYHSIIEHHIQWERILEILLINEYYDAIKQFTERIMDAIVQIKYSDAKLESKVRSALYLELHAAIARVFSLAYGEKPDAIIQFIYIEIHLWDKVKESMLEIWGSIYDVNKLRKAYNSTRMSDKSVIPIPVGMLNLDQCKAIALTNFQNVYLHLNRDKKSDVLLDENYIYYPYLINMHDIALIHFLREIDKDSPFSNYKKTQSDQKELYLKLNYGVENKMRGVVSVDCFHENDHLLKIFIGNENKSKLRIAIANTKLDHDNFTLQIKGKANRSYHRYCELSFLVNQAMKENADMLVMPESYLPFEWLSTLARVCASNQLAVVTGIEHFIQGNSLSESNEGNGKIFNFTAVILPYIEQDRKSAFISFHLKRHYAPNEIREIRGYNYREVEGSNYELYRWNGCYFPVYCCFELASIEDRALFQSYADFIIAVEWNRDVKYYSNIMESLSRDIHCYCIQVNSSDYGDSRITKPTKREEMDEIRTKGGKNSTILIGEIDIERLRNFQIKEYELQKEDKSFKPTPPDFKKSIVMGKIKDTLK